MKIIIACSLLALPGLSAAADVSTHSFSGCAFPDTGQTTRYSTAFGDDSDYQPSGAQLSFTVHNGADWGGTATSSVTVDNRTGLMWIYSTSNAGISANYYWTDALAACEGLSYAGFSDWRLPNVKELFSIVKEQGSAPYIDQSAFPGTVSDYYWTSNTYARDTTRAHGVTFNIGLIGSTSKVFSFPIRCVRGGP